MIFVTEDERRRYIENKIYSLVFSLEQQEDWLLVDEAFVIKSLKLWIKLNNLLDDVSIWVDPLSLYRYRLIPNWNLPIWLRDNVNIYNYPLDEK